MAGRAGPPIAVLGRGAGGLLHEVHRAAACGTESPAPAGSRVGGGATGATRARDHAKAS